jgi:hypothetical protein
MHQQQLPDTVSEQYGGKWVAWDEDDQHIVATGRTYEEAKQSAITLGVNRPVLEKVPPSDAAFAGGL